MEQLAENYALCYGLLETTTSVVYDSTSELFQHDHNECVYKIEQVPVCSADKLNSYFSFRRNLSSSTLKVFAKKRAKKKRYKI